MDELIIKNKMPINGLQNPGNFCYIISAIQSLRIILNEFYDYHSIFIDYYIIFSKMINIFDLTENYLLGLLDIKINRKDEFILNINKINAKYKLKNIKKISEIDFIFDKMKNEQLKICCMLLLKQIINELEDENINTVKTVNFIKMFNICSKHYGIDYICNGEQNDSNEFIIILLDYLNDCVSKGKICLLDDKSILSYNTEKLNEIDINNRIKIQMQQYYYKTYSKEYSYFHENLNILILNIIRCINCGFRQTSVNPTNNICCPIPINDKKMNIYNCLDNYFKEETIEYTCDKCGKKNDNVMTKKIIDNKEYIIITLKKFDYNTDLKILTKKHDNISYPLLLNINNYSLIDSTNYELVSIINHVGMLNYGHYYADVSYDNNWFRCNDENINSLKINNINNNNAYILIYKKT